MCEEQTFTPENRVFDTAHKLNVVINTLGKCNDTASVDFEDFPWLKLLLDHVSATVDEGHSVAFQFLHDETFAAEKSSSQFFLKFDSHRNSFRCTKEAVFLANHFTTECRQIKRNNLAGIRRRKSHLFLLIRDVGIYRHEKVFAGEHPFSGRENLAHQTFFRAVTKEGFHFDSFGHHHETSRFGDDAFFWVELYFHTLHFFAVDFVVNFVVVHFLMFFRFM